jgi:hypothetical protein
MVHGVLSHSIGEEWQCAEVLPATKVDVACCSGVHTRKRPNVVKTDALFLNSSKKAVNIDVLRILLPWKRLGGKLHL